MGKAKETNKLPGAKAKLDIEIVGALAEGTEAPTSAPAKKSKYIPTAKARRQQE